MKLSIALQITLSALSLSSTVLAQNSSFLRGNDNRVDGPFSELKCMLEGKTSEDICATSVTDEGDPCSYCTLSENGEEAGLCVNPDVAQQMMQVNEDVSCSNTAVAEVAEVEGPFSELKCMLEGKTSEEICATSLTDEGDPCSYCTLSENGEEAGLCVNPDVAQQMMQVNEDVSCSQTVDEVAEVKGPFSRFKCMLEGKTSEDKCAASVTDEGDPCSYCTMSENGEEAGLCVNPDVAEQMMQINEEVSCTNTVVAEVAKVEGPFSELKCMLEGKTSEDICDTAVTDEGDPCSYCTLSENGEEAGLCVNPDVAQQMMQVNEDVSCSHLVASIEAVATEIEGPFSELKCMLEGKTSEDICATSVTDEGDPCSYCTLSENGEEAGLCVNPDVAEQMMQVNEDVSCTNTVVAEVAVEVDKFDKSDFKCTVKGKVDPKACSATKTSGGKACEYCSIDGSFGEKGICVSPKHAKKIKKFGGKKVSCISHEEITSTESLSSNPVTDCNLKGIDHETCLDPSKVNGSDCVWCDARIGGFCFPKSWENAASSFLDCGKESTEVDHPTVDSSCFNVGLHGGSPDDCRKTIDTKTGEKCVFCNAPRLGGIGLCMPPDYKGTEGKFYICDSNVTTE